MLIRTTSNSKYVHLRRDDDLERVDLSASRHSMQVAMETLEAVVSMYKTALYPNVRIHAIYVTAVNQLTRIRISRKAHIKLFTSTVCLSLDVRHESRTASWSPRTTRSSCGPPPGPSPGRAAPRPRALARAPPGRERRP